jgi:succinate dehydrogenase/fumarate reductase flavoprotein subunit
MRLSNWEKIGIIRDEKGLQAGLMFLGELKDKLLKTAGIPAEPRAYNIPWNDWLNMRNLLDVSEIVGLSALQRRESRGAHYRSDFPKKNNKEFLRNIFIKRVNGKTRSTSREFSRLKPEDIKFE